MHRLPPAPSAYTPPNPASARGLGPPPDPQDLLRELHQAVYGDAWARPETPGVVWRELIRTVEAWRRAILSNLGGKPSEKYMAETFDPFARGHAKGFERGRNGALAEAAALARFIQKNRAPDITPEEEQSPEIIGHTLGCASIAEHLEMMRRGPRLHDDSCPACKWISDQLEEKAK